MIETTPARCRYWSVQAWNHWGQSMTRDPRSRPRLPAPDRELDERVLRAPTARCASSSPNTTRAWPNWLRTFGWTEGVLIFRYLYPESGPVASRDERRRSRRITPDVTRARREVASIGVYGFDLAAFLGTLRDGGVVMLFDVRQRRGVRGSEYARGRTPAACRRRSPTPGVAYEHHRELAPTTELRHVQYAEDARRGVGKRSRTRLAPEYADRYVREILDHVDLGALVARMPESGVTALLCMERDPEACHRSLITDRLATRTGRTRPPPPPGPVAVPVQVSASSDSSAVEAGVLEPDRVVLRHEAAVDGAVHHPHDDRAVARRREDLEPPHVGHRPSRRRFVHPELLRSRRVAVGSARRRRPRAWCGRT